MGGLELALPEVAVGAEHVWHLFVVRSEDRDGLMGHLSTSGVQCLIHYPIPPHMQGAYRDAMVGPQPIAEMIAGSVVSLPMGPHLTDSQVDYVLEAIRDFTRR